MQKLPKINIFKLKKILQNKGYRIYKRQNVFPKVFENLYYTTIVGFLIIGFLYVTPSIVNFSKKNFSKNAIVLNNSNINFNKP